MQTVLRLPNDGELTLTWAQLVTPAGYYLQTHGVVPTVCTSDLDDDAASLQIAGCSGPARSPRVSPRRRGRGAGSTSAPGRSCGVLPGAADEPGDRPELAEHLLADQRLYVSALHALRERGPAGAAIPPRPAHPSAP